MRISCTCEKCNIVSIGTEEDAFMEFDFVEKQVRFYCRNTKCKHINVFDFGGWKEKQEASPLPLIRMM